MERCKYCEREFTNKGGLGSHEPFCPSNPNKIKRYRSVNAGAKKGSIPWNKGKSMTDEQKNKLSIAMIGKNTGTASTNELEKARREKISKTMKLNPKSGGLRKGSGIGKSGWYKKYWCDSTWELAWVIYNLETHESFERNKEGFEYEYRGTIHRYFPDFIKYGIYYEIKGRRGYDGLSEKNKCKIDQFKKELKVLYKDEMQESLNYVINKYGKDFHRLYGRNPAG